MSETKEFLEGLGKVAQLKGVNTTQRQWVGIKIIMFVNNLHEMMTKLSFSTESITDPKKLNYTQQKITDREAFLERFQFFELTKQYKNKSDKDFPFDATDMARFILQVINGTLPEIPDAIEEEYEPILPSVQPIVLMAEIAKLKLKLAARDQEIEDLKLEARVGQKRGYETESDEFSKSKRSKSDREDLKLIHGGGSMSVNLNDIKISS